MEHYRVDTTKQLDKLHIAWEMDEYLQYDRGWLWWLILFMIISGLSFLGYWLSNGEIIVPISILSMALMFLIFSLKQPRQQTYSLNDAGVKIGSEFYEYDYFKNFSLLEEDKLVIVYLSTNQRFKPSLNLFLPIDENTDEILSIIAEYIIYDPDDISVLDRLLHILRF